MLIVSKLADHQLRCVSSFNVFTFLAILALQILGAGPPKFGTGQPFIISTKYDIAPKLKASAKVNDYHQQFDKKKFGMKKQAK